MFLKLAHLHTYYVYNHLRYKGETILSTHFWGNKYRGSAYNIFWRIFAPFTPVTKSCSLCSKEKFYILRKPDVSILSHKPI